MIICRTPFRVSLFGGSTDYQEFYSENKSLLIGFTINKYGYIVIRKTPHILPHKTKISYSEIETIFGEENIKHNGVRGVFDFLDIKDGFEISYLSDLPARTGIGSSSSFIVGLLNSFYYYKNKNVCREQLSNDAIFVERKLLKESGGIQDQIWAAYGGFNSIDIDYDGTFKVKPLPVDSNFKKHFIDRSVMIYTGQARDSFKTAGENSKNSKNKNKIKDLAHEAYQSFIDEDVNQIGHLLRNSWNEKKKISINVSNRDVDNMYNELTEDGMIGGKLLGSGGSGFIFGLLDEKIDKLLIKKKYKNNFIDFDISNGGSEIING